MSEVEQPSGGDGASNWLTHQWIVAGIVSASARFIPVPFVDDIVREQCRKFAVARTLAAHQREDLQPSLKPYYGSADGCVRGCVGMIAKLPLKIVLFPIRKVLAVVTSVRGVPLEVIRTVLLARTLDRQLTSAGENIDTRRAAQMRVAFDETFAGTDFRVVRAAIGDALRGVRGLKSAASDMAARLATKQGRQAEEEIGSAKDQRVDAGATRVEQALASAEIMELFAEFDRRFDKALANVGQRPSAS